MLILSLGGRHGRLTQLTAGPLILTYVIYIVGLYL